MGPQTAEKSIIEDREEKLRAYNAMMQGQFLNASPKDACSRPSLGQRVADQLGQAHREARKRDHLEELNYLLGKNPDIARILDLVEELRA